MDLIKQISDDHQWTELNERFNKEAYPAGVRAHDVKAWIRVIRELAEQHKKKLTRKFMMDVLFGRGDFEDQGVLDNDPRMDEIRGENEKLSPHGASIELQIADALWRDLLSHNKDTALKQYHKRIENEEKHGGLHTLTQAQLRSVAKRCVDCSHTEMYGKIREEIGSMLEDKYGVNMHSMSKADHDKFKEMVDAVADMAYDMKAAHEEEEVGCEDCEDTMSDFDMGYKAGMAAAMKKMDNSHEEEELPAIDLRDEVDDVDDDEEVYIDWDDGEEPEDEFDDEQYDEFVEEPEQFDDEEAEYEVDMANIDSDKEHIHELFDTIERSVYELVQYLTDAEYPQDVVQEILRKFFDEQIAKVSEDSEEHLDDMEYSDDYEEDPYDAEDSGDDFDSPGEGRY